ncbi:5-methyltetrahydropteroyltriglutamate--homocysteine S-methyltransferase [Kineococcus sp. R8]|uniref:5-methyltetrahydropteroyltriglutamate-- homocysteine S-methyltransferase n=1 Tax=Kineococcus siccus TaxID=2696567 RepID=UPI0014131E14|nr:5-methyltetrahydropteroyltriglutamate--homocysteine S-methyltransferase [Kineococcus siccus]
MARRLEPPFRADHVGSLLRPAALLEAREQAARGELDAAGLRAAEDVAVRDAVALQSETGLQTVTDGEFRRSTWHMDFIYRLAGVSRAQETLHVTFHNEAGDLDWAPAALKVDGRIGLRETIFGDDFTFLRDAAEGTGTTPKLTIPSPSMVHYRGGRAALDPAVYPDEGEFWDDLSRAYAAELAGLGELGCTHVQLDDTSLAYLNDPAQREALQGQGRDAAHQHERYVRQMNAAIADRPASMRVTTHLCRGNFRSSWVASGGYDFVAEVLFGELAVDGYFLEFDDERSGGFEPLRFVPPGKTVVLGLVTTKRGALEDKDALKRRIDEAARYVPLEQLCLSPQCGFSSTVEGNSLTAEEQRAKLRLVVETAAEVWG